MSVKAGFLRRVQSGVLLFDGATGTQIQAQGLPRGTCPEEWNISHPRVIEQIHRTYFQSGSDVVTTNSFGGNRFLLEEYGHGDRVREFNLAAARLAGGTCPEGRWVAGSVGPTGELLEPYGLRTFEEIRDGFSDQISALAEGGVDLLCIETMSDLEEIRAAIEAAKTVSDLPVCATMAFDLGKKGYRTIMGVGPQEAARTLEEAGADVIGCNCGGVSVEDMADLVRELRGASPLPILAQANAGLPQLVDDETVHPQGPEEYSEGVIHLLEAGATLIGGCCGTTPDHIRATAQRIRDHLLPRYGSDNPSRSAS